MPVSAVQIVVGSHQHCRERDSGSPWRAGGDPLLCKESHFYLYFLSGMLSSVLDDEKMFSIHQIFTRHTIIHFARVLTLNEFSAVFQTSDKNGFFVSCCEYKFCMLSVKYSLFRFKAIMTCKIYTQQNEIL